MAQYMINSPALDLPLFAFDDRVSACQATADALAAFARGAINEGRRARIALSGGSSPAPAYRAFATMDLDWGQVDIALVDDRWVDLDDPGSNEAMIRGAFAAAKGVTIHSVKTKDALPFDGAATLEPIYESLRPFDAIVLGMGPDAHTASWFPGSPQLADCLAPDQTRTLIGVDANAAPVAVPYPYRITMTLPAVAEAGQLIVLLFGADKKQILANALDTDVTQAPIRAVLEACGERVVVFWAE
jgi:6-phosphogluconolactonase